MTGPRHYRDAEMLLGLAERHRDTGDREDARLSRHFAAEAQVHAILALVAATLESAAAPQIGEVLWPGSPWSEALS